MIAFILAAGESTRFGRCKQVEPLMGLPMIVHVIRSIPGQIEVVVITGAYAELVGKAVSPFNVQILHNSDYKNGIGSSIKTAATYAKIKNSPMLITLADLPFVSSEDYSLLLKSFNKAPVFSSFNKSMGPPAIIPEHNLELLLNLKDNQGAKAVITDYLTVHIPNASRDLDFANQLTNYN
jgi:molybdenum cofactor cytidylyltransferase